MARYSEAEKQAIMRTYLRWQSFSGDMFGETPFTMTRRKYPRLKQSTLRGWLLLWGHAQPHVKRGRPPKAQGGL
jgi:hypothetical protein